MRLQFMNGYIFNIILDMQLTSEIRIQVADNFKIRGVSQQGGQKILSGNESQV